MMSFGSPSLDFTVPGIKTADSMRRQNVVGGVSRDLQTQTSSNRLAQSSRQPSAAHMTGNKANVVHGFAKVLADRRKANANSIRGSHTGLADDVDVTDATDIAARLRICQQQNPYRRDGSTQDCGLTPEILNNLAPEVQAELACILDPRTCASNGQLPPSLTVPFWKQPKVLLVGGLALAGAAAIAFWPKTKKSSGAAS